MNKNKKVKNKLNIKRQHVTLKDLNRPKRMAIVLVLIIVVFGILMINFAKIQIIDR